MPTPGSNKVGTVPIGQVLTLAATAYTTVEANAVKATFDLLGYGLREVLAILDLDNADTDAGDTLDVYLDASIDGVLYYNFVHFTQIAGTTAAGQYFAISGPQAAAEEVISSDVAAGGTPRTFLGRYIRVRHTLVDADATNATFTYSLKLIVR